MRKEALDPAKAELQSIEECQGREVRCAGEVVGKGDTLIEEGAGGLDRGFMDGKLEKGITHEI